MGGVREKTYINIRIKHICFLKNVGNQEQFDMLEPPILGTMGKNEAGKVAGSLIKMNI